MTSAYAGPLPTIGDTRREGMSAFSVTCGRPNCLHSAYFDFDALSLPDDMAFVHIPKHRRFVCSRCTGREVTVMPDWRQHSAQGAPRRCPGAESKLPVLAFRPLSSGKN